MEDSIRTFVNGNFVETHRSMPADPPKAGPDPAAAGGADAGPGVERRGFRSCWAAGRELAKRCETDGLARKCFRI